MQFQHHDRTAMLVLQDHNLVPFEKFLGDQHQVVLKNQMIPRTRRFQSPRL